MSATIESEQQTPNPPLSNLVSTISSYEGNVLLAAIISLLLVILFVLLLHLYAKWFLAHARQRSRSSSTLSHVFPHDRFRHFHAFSFDNNASASSPSKGLDPSLISSIPLFVFKLDEHSDNNNNNNKKHGLHNLDCVVCLSPFEDNDVGRNLPKCGHGFHLECIDMWLHSHSNCPICRAPVLLTNDAESQVSSSETMGESLDSGRHHQIAAPIDDDDDDLSASSSIGCSLKRMLSRNRSESKVFPTSNGGDLQV
ncbi:hypothetical protein Golob_023544 [Gossypium lobatum]|uniref:RING-type E3 ubiquitin transferase n=2 Tax=Gossypium TaxID=3633 RepID=A0A7J8WUS8_GOSAI|nr:hypothetical protein [Gossypium lobatum]MBA0678766.1 hypothetical protein [Gossypium aridum]